MKLLGQNIDRILAYRQAVDMRKSFDGLLSVLVEAREDSLDGTLYVFFNKSRNYIKGIVWHRTGYVLWAKRLERGRFHLPGESSKEELREQIFLLILDGISLQRIKK